MSSSVGQQPVLKTTVENTEATLEIAIGNIIILWGVFCLFFWLSVWPRWLQIHTALKYKYAELYNMLIHFKYDNNNRCLFSKLCKASDVWRSTTHAKSEGLLRFETSNGNSSNGLCTFCSHLYLLSCCILKSQRCDLVLVWESDSHLHLENADLLYYTSSEI